MLRRFGLIELQIYLQGWFLEAARWPQKPEDQMGRFWRMVALGEAALIILALWIMGAFSNA